MRKICFFAALLLFLRSPAQVQSAMNTAPADGSVSASAQQLSPAQKEVWAAEESMHRYEQQRDMKLFLSLWDDNFVGWPDYEPLPVRKPKIEKDTVEEFQGPKPSGPSLPPPKPEAIGIFGDVAVTHYFWPEADQTSPTVFRTTHTWEKGPQGWQIIGGMSCEVPRSGITTIAPASGQVPAVLAAANPHDVNTLDGIIAASYEALSGPVGAPRQWARYLSLLDPQARLVSASVDATTCPWRIANLPGIQRVFGFLLRFCDAQSDRSCYPLDRHAGPVARTWWRPFPGRGVASPETPAPDRESLPATIAESIRVGPHPRRLAVAPGTSSSSAPFRNCTEALDTARPSQSHERAKVPDAILGESPTKARPERTERRLRPESC
jgi:Domain of unknown function (DUF4440)